MIKPNRVVIIKIRSTRKIETLHEYDSALIAKKKFAQLARKEFNSFLHNWTVAFSSHKNSTQVLLYQNEKLTELIKIKN